jgi:hypothetical protein
MGVDPLVGSGGVCHPYGWPHGKAVLGEVQDLRVRSAGMSAQELLEARREGWLVATRRQPSALRVT